MNTGIVLKSSFLTGFCITLAGAVLKIVHAEGAETLLIFGLLTWLVFIVTALFEIFRSKRVDNSEKLLWSVALIFMGGIAGIVYLLMGRKKVASAL